MKKKKQQIPKLVKIDDQEALQSMHILSGAILTLKNDLLYDLAQQLHIWVAEKVSTEVIQRNTRE